MLRRKISNRLKFVRRINCPQLRRLGHAQRADPGRMHIAVSGQHLGRCREIEPAVFAPDGQQFGAAGKKLRRAAFVRLDVGALMTKDALKRPAKLREARGRWPPCR